MKAIEPELVDTRQLESEGFRFHPASAETGTRGRVAIDMAGPYLFYPVIPAKAGIHFNYAWERGRPARMRGPEVRRRSPPPCKAGGTPAFPGGILQGFRPEADGTST